ncbi:hypothetical protein GIB67_040178, partial [Kingdonia uniflora]
MGRKKAQQVDGEDKEKKAKHVFRKHLIIKIAFIEKCQKQINKKRLQGNSLSPAAWKEVMDEMNAEFYQAFTQKELKNQWDYLRKSYMLWRSLTTRTGHGYDEASGTFDWPKEYWADILVLLKGLFEGTIATGDYAYATGSEYVPTTQLTSEFVHIVDGDILMDTTDFGASGIDNPWDGMNISIDDVPISPTTQPSPTNTTPRTPASRNGSAKGKRSAANVEPSSLINKLIYAISNNGLGSGSNNNNNTMSEVMHILDNMLETNEIDESFYYLVLKMLGGADQSNYRIIFLNLDERRRLGFLKMLI